MKLTHDFSINYNLEKGLMKKFNVYPTPEVSELLAQAVQTRDDDELGDDLSILGLHDPDALELRRILDILSVERCEDYQNWFKIVCSIAYLGEKYKPLAVMFSKSRPKGIREKFEKTWEQCRANIGKYPYTKEMIYSFARKDNPEEYQIIMNDSVITMMNDFVHDNKTQGHLKHWHIACLLKAMIGTKFIVDYPDPKSKQAMWYEFILEDDRHVAGELYKWKACPAPIMLNMYISQKMPIVFDRMAEILIKRKDEAQSDDQIKYFERLLKNVYTSANQLNDFGFKRSVLSQCEANFSRPHFSKSLDQEPNILGVGNGVLDLSGDIPFLIQSYHPHPVSRYTPVKYTPIDPNDPLVQAVFKSLWDSFPAGEHDAFEWIMFYTSTSLTARMKAALFLTLSGNGANGKSYFMELIRGILGNENDNGYGCKLPISWLIERDRDPNSASPILVGLMHGRMVYFSEAEKSEQLRVSKKNLLTSQEPITVRPLYGSARSIIPKAIYMLGTNHQLSINSTDHGTWRRERHYCMKMKYTNHPDPTNMFEKLADPSFTEKKSKDPEFLGAALSIFTMFLGILDMKYDGNITKVVSSTIDNETEMFRNSQDVINRFITERIVETVDDTHETSMVEILDIYVRWHASNIADINHDRNDLRLQLYNSRLGNYKVTKENGTVNIKGYRALAEGVIKDHGEEYLIPPVLIGRANPNIELEEPTAQDCLMKLYREYTQLAKDRGHIV
jgi:phage/plasmid-associated DNA primase